MNQQIGETKYPKARKRHYCMASDWIVNGDLHETFRNCDWSEKRDIIKARRNGWRIQPGERYLNQTMKWDGEIGTFRAIPAMHEICVKYDMYEE